MTDQTPQPTGLAGLVAEVHNVEAKLEAMEAAPAPAPAIPPTPTPAPIPATPPVTPPPAPLPTPPAMVISDEPIPVPADAVPVPTAAPPVTEPSPTISSPALDAAAVKEAARIADLEAQKQAFYDRIRAAQKAGLPPAPVPQPIPERILAQTELEKAAGAAAVAAHAAAQGRRIIPPDPKPGIVGFMTPVFRPGDYVPDQKKGQGNVSGTVLT